MKKVKKKKCAKILCIVIGICTIFFLIIYLSISFFFIDHFFVGTEINHFDSSGKTIDEVTKGLKKQMDEYTLNINGRNEKRDVIRGEGIFIINQKNEDLKEILEKQDFFLWPKYLKKNLIIL